MKCYYSVVRYVPDTFRGEFVNVAVIVWADEGTECQVRRLSNTARARAVGNSSSLLTVWSYLDDIESIAISATDEFGEADPSVDMIDRSWMEAEHRRLNNLVQLSRPAPVLGDDIDDATRKMFDLYVVEPDRQRRNTRSSTVAALKSAYLSTISSGLVHQRVHGELGRQNVEIDFAIGNGSLVQLAHAWSFRAQNTRPTVDKVKAWSWTIRDIRENGGSIVVPGRDEPYRLTEDVSVDVVYDEPQTDQGRRDLDESLEVFEHLHVKAVSAEGVREIANEAVRALREEAIAPHLVRELGNENVPPPKQIEGPDADR